MCIYKQSEKTKRRHTAINSRKPKEWVRIANGPSYRFTIVRVLLLKGLTQLLLLALPCSCLTLHCPISLSAQPCFALNLILLVMLPLFRHFQTLIISLTIVFLIDVASLLNPIPKAYLLLLLNNSCGAWSILLPLANFIIVRKLEHHMSFTTTGSQI